MNKRIQIPITESEARLFQVAAKKTGLSLAEWARQLMKAKATETMGPIKKTPEAALQALFEINAPVDDVQVMINQSFKGRYK
jgi:hypothetical protein